MTHLIVLGWLCPAVMGAMYQLVPVALETKLHSEKLGHWQFYFHVIGVAGMVWTFWIWNMKAAGYFGILVAVSAGMFVYNVCLQPFLVWYGSYSGVIGRGKVPALADLYSPGLQAARYFTFLAGLLLAGIGVGYGHHHMVRCGCHPRDEPGFVRRQPGHLRCKNRRRKSAGEDDTHDSGLPHA